MDQKVRVRYAPSPTGFLHIGNAQSEVANGIAPSGAFANDGITD